MTAHLQDLHGDVSQGYLEQRRSAELQCVGPGFVANVQKSEPG